MRLLMISGDRSVLQGKKSAFFYTLEELSKHWDRIDVICPRVGGEFRILNSEFSTVFFHPSPSGLWKQSRWIEKKGSELFAEHHHDVMTVHEYPPFYNGIGAKRLHQKTGIPYVLEIHHIVGYPVASSVSERIGRILSQLYFPHDAKQAVAVRVVNRKVKETLNEWGVPSEKISVVPSFYLDASLLKPDPSIDKKYDIVFCGRLVSNKGLPELLLAVRDLPDISFLVIGDGPLRSASEQLAHRYGITNRVTFAGWLPAQEDVIKAIQSAHVFVMNSRSEGGPRVPLEAMACGMPVVTTRVGVMPDVVRDGVNGVFTDGTPADLVRKISHLLHNETERAALGREATAVIRSFERKHLIAEYASFLQSVARS